MPGSATYDVRVRSIDPSSCETCENDTLLAHGFASNARMWSQRASGAASDVAVLAWTQHTAGSDRNGIVVQRYRADDGSITDVGGGCGGGVARAFCSRLSRTSYSIWLENPPRGTNYLLLAPGHMEIRCGSCSVVTTPMFTLFGSGSAERTEYPLVLPPIPSAWGLTFYAQWMTHSPGGSCPSVYSNALSITLQ